MKINIPVVPAIWFSLTMATPAQADFEIYMMNGFAVVDEIIKSSTDENGLRTIIVKDNGKETTYHSVKEIKERPTRGTQVANKAIDNPTKDDVYHPENPKWIHKPTLDDEPDVEYTGRKFIYDKNGKSRSYDPNYVKWYINRASWLSRVTEKWQKEYPEEFAAYKKHEIIERAQNRLRVQEEEKKNAILSQDYSNSSSKKLVQLSDMAVRIQETNQLWSRVAYKIRAKNLTGSPLTCDLRIQFLDRDGFELDTDRVYDEQFDGYEEKIITGSALLSEDNQKPASQHLSRMKVVIEPD